ncbi:flagellar basal body P-ring formation chaperone FlgA [Rubripirellula tenax]|uniref:flagellar basal body P-ring formation chaperone FlgA n=1 Tax=Rubripirellula tenax TaxID=2528015 RepID=UPI0016443047|nr:flagellar basal body P-ring formation chaperone FlgA [Rubripirellula tenax]
MSFADAQERSGTFDATIDSKTHWAFRTVSPVTVTSPIVRLGDIVEPLDPHQAGWQRLRRAAIGLVPVSGETMTIRRERLGKAILAAEATPRSIDWHGPSEIQVVYRKATASQSATQNDAIRTVNYESESVPAGPALSTIDAKRVIHWIEIAMKQFHPDVIERYEVTIPADQSAFAQLRYLSGVADLEPRSPIESGPCRFAVTARSVSGPIEVEVEVLLTQHPQIPVPTRSLGRGHRIEAADIELRPFASDKIDPNAISEMETLIGQEVRSNLRVGQAIMHGDFGSPILIHRGDLIEVRVVGGGVSVTTNGKALGDGSEAELIEIETLNPRKRLIARVARHGVVEITTRAPVLR